MHTVYYEKKGIYHAGKNIFFILKYRQYFDIVQYLDLNMLLASVCKIVCERLLTSGPMMLALKRNI